MDQIRQVRVFIAPIFFVASLLFGVYTDTEFDPAVKKDSSKPDAATQFHNDLRSLLLGNGGEETPAPVRDKVAEDPRVKAEIKRLRGWLQDAATGEIDASKWAAGGVVVIVGGIALGAFTRLFLSILSIAIWLIIVPIQCIRKHLGNCTETEWCSSWETFFSEKTTTRIVDKLGMTGSKRASLSKQWLWYFYIAVTFDHKYLRENHEGVHAWLIRRWNGFNASFSSVIALELSLRCGERLIIGIADVWSDLVTVLMIVLSAHAVLSWWETGKMIRYQAEFAELGPLQKEIERKSRLKN